MIAGHACDDGIGVEGGSDADGGGGDDSDDSVGGDGTKNLVVNNFTNAT
jgi:hypothetical protein